MGPWRATNRRHWPEIDSKVHDISLTVGTLDLQLMLLEFIATLNSIFVAFSATSNPTSPLAECILISCCIELTNF